MSRGGSLLCLGKLIRSPPEPVFCCSIVTMACCLTFLDYHNILGIESSTHILAVADFTCAGGSFFYSPRLKFKFKIVVDVTSDVLPLFFVTSFLLNFLNILLWVSRRDTQGHMNLRKHKKIGYLFFITNFCRW
jgi:hypothetical protein